VTAECGEFGVLRGIPATPQVFLRFLKLVGALPDGLETALIRDSCATHKT
jgi:hypothetical protein